jgi:large subunit ribosomal protein L10
MKKISPLKKQLVQDIQEIVKSSEGFFLVSYKGLTVAQFSELRKVLGAVEAKAHVVPNMLTEIAVVKAGLASSRDELALAQDTALVTGGTDPLQVAKILKEFLKKNEALGLKSGYFDARWLDAGEVEALAAIPPKEILYAMLLGVMQSGPRGLVCVLNAKAQELESAAPAAG